MQPVDMKKQRDIHFHAIPTDQASQAARALSRLANLHVVSHAGQLHITIHYELTHWTLESVEEHLVEIGFHLDGSLLQRLKRALIHYTESVQSENLNHPEREYKTKEVYIHAWEHHPHGDYDETPEELREYR